MKLSGEASLNATVPEVYAALHDPAILVRTLPGCQRLEQLGTDSYRATVLAGVASIKGTFDGEVRLSDQDAPHSFTLHAAGAGAPGTVNAVARVTLTVGQSGTTRLRYDAEATVGGVLGGVGQRMIAGVAKKTATEFFAAVDQALAGVAAPAGVTPAAVPAAAGPSGGMAAVILGQAPALGGVPTATAVTSPAHAVPATAAPATAALATGTGVWTAPPPAVDPARRRLRDFAGGALFGALIALAGVVVGVVVAGW